MSQAQQSQQEPSVPGSISLGVVWLGIVSFLTDVSSETIFAILPIYFIGVLGGSALLLGIMEGLADFASSSLDLAAGYASDRTGKRKWIAFSGYALSTTAKSLLVLATSVAGVVAFRVIERLGKSVRGAPRDALLASMAPKEKRGLSFGIHKAMDKAGAVIGPFLAYLVLARFGSTTATFHWLFVAALVPAMIAVIVLGIFVKDRIVEVRYRLYLLATAVFSLGYFSFAFLLLKAKTGMAFSMRWIKDRPKAYLADLSTDETRATAIGVYGFVTGLIYLPASLIAGALWSYGPAWTFAFAIATSVVALTLFLLTSQSLPAHESQT
jgi:MFS family permease